MAEQSTYEDGDVLSEAGYELAFPEYTSYTGAGFNASRTTVGTTSNNHTISIAAGEIKQYVKIHIDVEAVARVTSGGGTGDVKLKIETAENGGGFTSRYDKTIATVSVSDTLAHRSGTTTFFYTPTSGEKTNGLDIKITGSAVVTTATVAQCEIENFGVYVEYY